MGEAKRRGSRDSRVAEAVAKLKALQPDFIECNNCNSKLTDIELMDTRGTPGIEAAFGAYCSNCESITWALLGDPDAVADFYATLESEVGPDIKIGSAKKPTDAR